MIEITDKQLKDFCSWFAARHRVTAPVSVIATCMCGKFHTYTQHADKLVKRCVRLKLIRKEGDNGTVSV